MRCHEPLWYVELATFPKPVLIKICTSNDLNLGIESLYNHAITRFFLMPILGDAFPKQESEEAARARRVEAQQQKKMLGSAQKPPTKDVVRQTTTP